VDQAGIFDGPAELASQTSQIVTQCGLYSVMNIKESYDCLRPTKCKFTIYLAKEKQSALPHTRRNVKMNMIRGF
jgi:hypothetical protein